MRRLWCVCELPANHRFTLCAEVSNFYQFSLVKVAVTLFHRVATQAVPWLLYFISHTRAPWRHCALTLFISTRVSAQPYTFLHSDAGCEKLERTRSGRVLRWCGSRSRCSRARLDLLETKVRFGPRLAAYLLPCLLGNLGGWAPVCIASWNIRLLPFLLLRRSSFVRSTMT
jgi:hypothetical protein